MSYLLIGLAGPSLSAAERRWLRTPPVAGVVLFGRNFADPVQLAILIEQIREADPRALICVDQEGGPVQRFGAPCTVLPALAAIGRGYQRAPERALELAFAHGALMATEMLALGVDLSFAPVLDLDRGSRVIGQRALHRDPAAVAALGCRYLEGMRAAGMATCGKHFPGHGSVREDTHLEVAVDRRDWDQIERRDLVPFAAAVEAGLDAVMMAHVRYPAVCPHPAGYSKIWIADVLRRRLGFGGVVISDDLGMRAAAAGTFAERVAASLEAGCDLVLVCRPDHVEQAMSDPAALPSVPGAPTVPGLRAGAKPDWDALADDPRVDAWRELLNRCH